MKKKVLLCLMAVMAAVFSAGCGSEESVAVEDQLAMPEEGETVAEIQIRDYGSIFVRFFEEAAPKAVENFIQHSEEGYYDGLTFHRVIDDFMIQGGDPEGTGAGGESIWGEYFEDEFSDTLYPLRGALCMANRGSDTNGSQFFIVQADASTILDMEEQLAALGMTLQEYMEQIGGAELTDEALELYEEYGGTPWLHMAHTVFGQVYDGYDVLDAVAGAATDSNDVPEEEVVIETITILTYGE